MLIAAPAVLAFFSGGYDVEPQLIAAAVAFALLGVVVVAAPWPLVTSRPALVAVVALVGLAAWTGVSIAWARLLNPAAEEAAQLSLYAAAFAAAVVVLRDPAVRRAMPATLLVGVVAVALYALAVRLLPDVFPSAANPRAGERSDQPLTYWNALGLLMAFGILLAAAVASDDDRRPAVRTLACASSVPVALVLYLTFSRGSLVAVAAGFVALVLARPRRATLLFAALCLAAVALLAASVQLLPAVLELDRGASQQTSQGAKLAVLLVAVTGCVGLAFARLSRSRLTRSTLTVPRALRTGLALATVAAVLAIGAVIASGDEETDPLPSTQSRLTTLTTNRGAYWRVALEALTAHPATGVGAASFTVEWRRERETGESAVDAHSLYVETLGELGLVGGALLAAFLGAVIVGVLRQLRGRRPDPVAPAAAACLTAFLVHVGLDWTWEFAAVTLIALLFAAAAVEPAVRAQGDPA